MKTYKVLFTPTEPYFFGNEKNFSFPKQEHGTQFSNKYFIKSELMPLQTTLLGALRYIFLPVKKSDYKYTADEMKKNTDAVGKESFNVEKSEQSFGLIRKISPVFLSKNGENYVVTPFDHIKGRKEYTPFSGYIDIQTDSGRKKYTNDFDVKEGIDSSFMNVRNGEIVGIDKIFGSVTRVGIDIKNKEDAFFKKEYRYLNKDWSFAVYMEADDSLNVPEHTTVFMGQGKAAFGVTFSEEANTLKTSLENIIRKDTVYCLGDSFVCGDLYGKSLFSIVKTRDYRAYETYYTEGDVKKVQVRKKSALYRMVSAGSVFICDNKESFVSVFENKHNQTIGFNTVISGGK